jgi:hypothetical protein
MPGPALIPRRAHVARKRGELQPDNYDVFDGDRDVGRIYLVHATDLVEPWFWGHLLPGHQAQELCEHARGGKGGVPGGIRDMEGNR